MPHVPVRSVALDTISRTVLKQAGRQTPLGSQNEKRGEGAVMAKNEAQSSVAAVPLSRMTTREDGLSLGPEQSHRIIAVLEEAAEKLGFLGSIMPDVLQHRDELSKFVGDEISRIIQVQNLGGAF